MAAKWLLLIHAIPARPDYLRVKAGRQLRRLGAVAIKNSVYVLPNGSGVRPPLVQIAREILEQGGEAVICEAQFVEGLSDGGIEDLHREARDAEYSAVAREAKRVASELKGRSRNEARLRKAAQVVERLRLRFDEIVARDAFGARGREAAAGLVSLAEDRIQGVEVTSGPKNKVPEAPRAATWVTRTGPMVDRIASAWLIRRFIDPAAKFKFVRGRTYAPARNELRFDMTAAEFTHTDGRCTFEELVLRFKLRDSALQPIAEIVHDLDFEDDKFRRPEASGVERMIVGLAIAEKGDEARITQGAALFDSLYESFRRRAR